jgi:5-methyltetrahydropteroyltriglutamate--homocysteine methyltransferase
MAATAPLIRASSPAPPFRAEHVGSLLRPPALKAAARERAAGRLDAAGFERAVCGCIRHALKTQEAAGLAVATDGEFRRGSWFLGFVDAVEGLTVKPSLFQFSGQHAAWDCPYAAAPLRRTRGITTAEFDFVRANTALTPKVTMPAPSQMLFYRGDEAADRAVYPRLDRLHADLVEVYRQEIADLARRGCRYVQLDEVPVALLCDPKVRDAVTARGDDPDALVDLYVDLVNAIAEAKPPGMTIGLHLCRGNYKGQWMAEGGYAPVAERLFRRARVDAFFLEYDSPRAGDFRPLEAVPPGVRVVLGLVSTKVPETPGVSVLVDRLGEAARYIAVERLSISPQCGFASSAAGNPISEADQAAKLAAVVAVARTVWGAA